LALADQVNGLSTTLEPPGGSGAVTWLRGIAPVEALLSTETRPTGLAYQTVTLRAGTRYVLSWWDMARALDGSPYSGGAPLDYRVAAFDASWNTIAQDVIAPSTAGWSPRKLLEVVPFADGEYHIAFSPAGAGTLLDASLALANVQLEAGAGSSAGASAYQSTSSSRVSITGNCPVDTPSAFRRRFAHVCDETGCWRELEGMLVIDTELLKQGASPLVGQVAQGNYNYRIGGVALNVVGTGVLDCARTGTASCYSSGYIEYDLRHHAHHVPLDDHSGTVRCFDFGTGNIRSGKALAAERFLTLPFGAEDRAMVSESPFLKAELTGRPLSGSYRLRIKDSPALVWENVEDIQIVMDYHYWSRVDRAIGQ
jgi:hypothetical protein